MLLQQNQPPTTTIPSSVRWELLEVSAFAQLPVYASFQVAHLTPSSWSRYSARLSPIWWNFLFAACSQRNILLLVLLDARSEVCSIRWRTDRRLLLLLLGLFLRHHHCRLDRNNLWKTGSLSACQLLLLMKLFGISASPPPESQQDRGRSEEEKCKWSRTHREWGILWSLMASVTDFFFSYAPNREPRNKFIPWLTELFTDRRGRYRSSLEIFPIRSLLLAIYKSSNAFFGACMWQRRLNLDFQHGKGGEKEKERDKDVSLEYRLMSWDFCVAVGLELKMEIETVKLL